MKSKIAIVVIALFSLLHGRASAWEDTPESVFERMQNAANEGDWETLLSLTTASVGESLVYGEITSAALAIDREFPPGPKGDRNRQRIEELFASYDIDEIERPESPDFSQGRPSKKVMEAFAEQKRLYAKKVLEQLEDRNDFLADLSMILEESPVPMGSTIALRLGEIARIEVEGDSASAIVEVDPSRLSDDPTVINVMPPTPILFQQEESGTWKYAGIDQVKQKEIAERHLDLWKRDNGPEGGIDSPEPEVHSTPESDDVMLTANWIPFDDDSTYGFAKKWPEINAMKPVAKERGYGHEFFQSMVPKADTKIGDVWEIDETALLPLLKQFHDGASVKLHHGGPTGAYGCLMGTKDELLNIVVRLHGELRHEDGWYYTVSQFEGQLVWNRESNEVESFRLFVPPVRTNVDVNRSATLEEIRDKVEYKGLNGVDIGFIPVMELVSKQQRRGDVEWEEVLDLDEAKELLAKKFYRSALINWLPWEEAVHKSQESGKPLLVVALFGTLYDESC